MSLPNLPKVSVVVPVRNEARNIERCIGQLTQQDYPRDRLEILIADGRSEDETVEIAEKAASKDNRIRVLKLSEKGRSQGLNRGICAATGEVILRMDGRTSVQSDYVRGLVETLLTTGADNVGPAQRPIARTRKQKAIGLALCHPFGVGNSQYRLGTMSGYVEHVYLGCFRRDLFDRIGYFDEEAAVITEDADFSQRIWNSGGKVFLNSDISAYYYPRETFADFWRLYFRYGGARAGSLLKHRRLTSWRQIVAPAFIVALVSTLLLSIWSTMSFYAFLAILASYGIASAWVAISIGSKNGDFRLVPLILVAFACMHFAWGIGFLKRLVVAEKSGGFWPD